MNNEGNLISVIMSVFNEPEVWLRESIESILNQTFNNFEFIIINDNPDSETNKLILNEYKEKDNRIAIINNEKNIGLTKSLNKGIDFAKGEYIVRMDADDYSFPYRLEFQYEFMQNNLNCVLCGSAAEFYYENKKNKKRKIYFLTDYQNIKWAMVFKNPILHPTVIMRMSVVKQYNIKYNTEIKYSQDYDLWCKLINYGELRNLDRILIRYRISNLQISTSKRAEQDFYANAIRRNYLMSLTGFSNINDLTIGNIKQSKFGKIAYRYLISSFYLEKINMFYFLLLIIRGDFFIIKRDISFILKTFKKKLFI
ncbi:glycosyl transferase [Tenuifilaceae bacterium CYCD]|nr:glycosyl transferase [Tenuifilaceae bacterium CYCD]